MLYRFAGGRDGCASNAGLIFDGAGNLYGTTTRGGNQACKRGCGVVFELSPKPDGSWTESVLHRFSGADGSYAGADLIFDAGGNLYGTTSTGGVNNPCPIEGDPGCGTVFKLTPKGDGTWTESVLYSFCSSVGCTDGIFPDGRLVSDVAGNLYGTTGGGGTPKCGGGFGCGTVFMLTPKSDGSSTTACCTASPAAVMEAQPLLASSSTQAVISRHDFIWRLSKGTLPCRREPRLRHGLQADAE